MPEPSKDSRYWTLPIKGIAKAQNELALQKIAISYFYYDKYSQASFNNVSKNVLEANLDGILIAPVLPNVFGRFLKEIPDDLPYVFFDSFIPDTNYISYIGQDAFQGGILSAKLMEMIVKEKGSIAVFKVLPEDYHINDRVDGFLSYFEKCPEIETKVYNIDGDWNSDKQNKVFQRIISENKNLMGIFVSNASTHQIAEFIKSHSLQKKIHIIGYDLIEDNIKCLREGVIDFLISQQSEKQGYAGIYSLYQHVVIKEPVEKKNMMQLDIVTEENIDYYRN